MIHMENLARRFEDVREYYFDSLEQISKNENPVNGFYVKEVEQRLREISGRTHVAMVRSGSQAISIALMSHIEPGAEVIIPAYSCAATLASVASAGFVPRFVDINQYGSIDAEQIESHITSRTQAVVATGLYGDVHDHEVVKQVCAENKITYVNDAAQSQFAKYKGIDSLRLGDVVAVSFADNKPLPTLGTFGAVFTDSDRHYERIKSLRANGKTSHTSDFVEAGYSSKPDEDKAAQILAAMRCFDKWQARRKQVAAIYDAEFIKAGVVIRPRPPYSQYNTHKYAIMVEDKFEAFEKLKSQGIETLRHYQDNFAKLPWTPNTDEQFPMTDKYIRQSLSLPINGHMTDSEIYEVIEKVVNNTVAPSTR